jgi:D-alanyl-D-alanine carboxypeptidase
MRGLLTALLSGALIASSAPAHEAGREAAPAAGLDRIVAAGAVGAVAEVRTGNRVWRGASGSATLDTATPVPVDSRFRAGSITKTFVATVVLQLVAEGRLRLDDPARRWVPALDPRITVRELLAHTSGLFDYLHTLNMPPSPEFFADRWRTWTAGELVRRALAEPPTSDDPGRVFAYSNTGYLVLGEIISAVTGHSYADEIRHRLIRPLRLTGTSVPGTSPRIPGPHPHGYVRGPAGDLVDLTGMNPSVMGAGGEMISTTSDLNRFFAALFGGRLLPHRLLAEMEHPGAPGSRYGLGLFFRTTPCGVRVFGNDGDALAYQAWSYSTLDGSRQVSIAVTPNFDADRDSLVDDNVDQAVCGS